jgi:hypothetical protein
MDLDYTRALYPPGGESLPATGMCLGAGDGMVQRAESEAVTVVEARLTVVKRMSHWW